MASRLNKFQALRIASICGALILLCTSFVAPASALVSAPAPTDIVVSQDGFVMSADVTIDDSQTIGTVTIQVGTAAPIAIARPDSQGSYSRTLTAADIGSTIIYRATAVSIIGGKPATSDIFTSQPYVFTRAGVPTNITVTQDDMTLLVDVAFADSTMLGVLSMKVGTGNYAVVCDAISGDNCGDGPFEVEMNTGQLGKVITFRVVATPTLDLVPDSLPAYSAPFTFSQSAAPSSVTLTQDGYNINIGVGLAAGQLVGDVIVHTFTAPDGDYLDPVDGNYVYELSSDDIGHQVRVTATAFTGTQVMSAIKAATMTPGIAASPRFGTVQQVTNMASVPVSVAAGNGLVVEATLDGDPRDVTIVSGVARVVLTSDDADKTLVFYAHGTKATLPDSDDVITDDFVVVAADSPASITLTHTDATLCGKAELAAGQTLGAMTATVGGVDRAVVLSAGKRCITLVRADVGKEAVFSASARHAGQVDSVMTDSDAYLIDAAAAPTVKLAQSKKVVTATIRVAPDQQIGITTYTIAKGKPVTLKPVKGKYTFTVKPADVGKKVIVKTYATGVGLFPSVTVSSAALTIKK